MKVAQAIQPSCRVTCVKPIIFSMGCPHWLLKLALGFTPKVHFILLIILLVGHNWTIMWLVYNCQQQDAVSVDQWADDRKDVHMHVQDVRVSCDAENGPWRIVGTWRIIDRTLDFAKELEDCFKITTAKYAIRSMLGKCNQWTIWHFGQQYAGNRHTHLHWL